MAVFRLYPLAEPGSSNWDIAQNHGEVLVRAKTSGDARLVAAEAEAQLARRHDENDDVYSIRASAFTDEKLYGVQKITDSGIDPEGERGLIAGIITPSR
ncbi:hypothetical protein NO932_15830 [Pelagibacterium sp. 26DY04]|uniref:hypothetical protein n=1 Tax=unclassified Pelagibacterium TaxID=2623280 RepID=UPI00281687CF|nr:MULTISPECIES: hypothetical protein [unclassified Pelagibacterium]WMT86369.1 hypothetical protein NO932_15830 [Pelagibacterium sp. 26DY04]WMT89385.1 hypothetical protein NO934_11275 [Pelagibacterium sp. H642]